MSYYQSIGTALFLYMSLWFLVSLLKKRNDVADVAWGLGFVLVAWFALYLSGSYGPRALLVCLLVSLWGLRLAWHIHRRNEGKPEDYRYQKWRKDWGKWFILRSYLQVYLLQGLLLFIIALPVLVVLKGPGPALNWFDGAGILVWAVGFYFEVVGDAQLLRFKRDAANQGQLMQTGLWAYSRHPNYFGEVLLWWGIWLLTLSTPGSYYTLIGPLTITLLILKVSGIPMLEEKMEKHAQFEAYKRRTSRFIPMPKREV